MSDNLMDLGAEEDPTNNQDDPKAGDELETGDDSTPADPPEGDELETGDRPEHIPEKFWDKDKGEVKVDDVLKSYSEIEKELTKAKTPEKAPDSYELNIPDEFRDLIEIPDDDPMLVAYKEHAKEHNYSQEKFDRDFAFYLGFMNTTAEQDQKAEIETLGGEKEAKETIKNVRMFLKNRLSPESYEVLVATTTTAAQMKALDELRKLASVQSPPPSDPDNNVSTDLTEAELRALMKKPEYHDERKRDPELVKKVEEGFKKLYPSKKG